MGTNGVIFAGGRGGEGVRRVDETKSSKSSKRFVGFDTLVFDGLENRPWSDEPDAEKLENPEAYGDV